MRINLY